MVERIYEVAGLPMTDRMPEAQIRRPTWPAHAARQGTASVVYDVRKDFHVEPARGARRPSTSTWTASTVQIEVEVK